MTSKETAQQVLEALPDDASMDDIMHALYVRAKCEHGERQIREGQGTSHKDAKERILKWVE